jgi:hypothetical protein
MIREHLPNYSLKVTLVFVFPSRKYTSSFLSVFASHLLKNVRWKLFSFSGAIGMVMVFAGRVQGKKATKKVFSKKVAKKEGVTKKRKYR